MSAISQRLDELERVTKGATPGQWYDHPSGIVADCDEATDPDTDDDKSLVLCSDSGLGLRQVNANRAFVAALNPATVAALLGVVRAAYAMASEKDENMYAVHGDLMDQALAALAVVGVA